MNNKRNIIFIALAGVLVYANSLTNGFVWDDIFLVINNDFIKGFGLIKEIFLKPLYYFSNPDYIYYRPAQTLSYIFDFSIWGLRPFGFHLTNVLLHIIAAISIYFLIDILFKDQELSFFTSLLFVVHPINTSIINYVSSRADILFLISVALSLILFIKGKNYVFYFLSLIFYMLALLSKEVSLIFPVCLVFTNELYLKVNDSKEADSRLITKRFWYAPFVIVSFAYILFRTKVIGVGYGILFLPKTDFFYAIFTLVKIIINYLKLLFLPFGLHMLRNIPIVQLTNNITANLYIVFIILFGIILFLFYRMNKIIFFSLGFFLIWILPACFLALKKPEFYFQQRAIMEEHWLYIPSIGIFVLTFYLTRRYTQLLGKRFYKIVFLSFVIYLSIFTIKENTNWHDNLTLFSHTLKYVDNSPTVYRNLGWIYINKQETKNSIDMYRKALDLKQDDSDKIVLYKDIALAYFLNNEIDEAVRVCNKAININYNYADIYGYLGLIYSKNDLRKAKEEWSLALDIDPFNAISFNNLLILSKSDEWIRQYLIEKYSRVLNKYSNFDRYKAYRALGLIYLYNWQLPLALLNLKEANRINPYDIKINNALAVHCAESKDFSNAVRFFKIALRLNPFDKEAYNNLAVLYKQINRQDEANRLIKESESINMFY